MKLCLSIGSILALTLVASAKPTLAQSAPPTTAPSAVPTTAPTEFGLLPPPQVPLPPGMTPLFDGKRLNGWVQIPPDSWTVANGIIASKGLGRGVIYTTGQWSRYRIVFDIRHVYGNKDHRACVLVFCTNPVEGEKPLDALGGIQFQVPNGGHWDYRKGHNNGGKEEFTQLDHPKFDEYQWSRVEILVDAKTGTGRMAVAQTVGSKAVEVLDFKDETAGQKGPFALQMHNKGLFDEFANVAIEVDPKEDELITVKAPVQSPPSHEVTITRAEYGNAWPFTVDSGVLSGKPIGHRLSDGTDVAEVTFTTGGKTYYVNGIAKATHRYAELDDIWAADSSTPKEFALKKNMGPIIERGLKLAMGER